MLPNNEDKDKLLKAMRKPDSQIKARIDSELLEFRPMYSGLPADEKAALKEWIREVLAVQEKQPRISMDLSLKVRLYERIGEDEHRAVKLPLKVILNAMETWDRGELYAPTNLGELWGQ